MGDSQISGTGYLDPFRLQAPYQLFGTRSFNFCVKPLGYSASEPPDHDRYRQHYSTSGAPPPRSTPALRPARAGGAPPRSMPALCPAALCPARACSAWASLLPLPKQGGVHSPTLLHLVLNLFCGSNLRTSSLGPGTFQPV